MFSLMNHYFIKLWADSGLHNLFSIAGVIVCCMASIVYAPIFMQKFFLRVLLVGIVITIYVMMFPYRHNFDPTGVAKIFIFPNAIYNDLLGIFSRSSAAQTDLRDIYYAVLGALYLIFPYIFYRLYIKPHQLQKKTKSL